MLSDFMTEEGEKNITESSQKKLSKHFFNKNLLASRIESFSILEPPLGRT